jgi:hypothetical protein
MPVDEPDELASDLTGEHHPDDLHDLRRRDAQPGPELALETQSAEHAGDLRAASVHDDRAQAGIPEEDDVLGEGALEVLVDHGVAPVLDDDERALEPLEPRERLDERRSLRPGHPEGVRVDRATELAGGCVGHRSLTWSRRSSRGRSRG